MPSMVGVSEAIDGVHEANEKGPRPHLGASQIGKPCLRQIVYSFRHAAKKRTKGRMLRLFRRGHREEHTICADLRAIGFEVREYAERLTWHDASASYAAIPWEDTGPLELGEVEDVSWDQHHVACAEAAGVKLKQWSFSDHGGHHAGSTDGKAMNPSSNLRQFPAIPPDTWFGLEMKTFNSKSFLYLLGQAEKMAATGGSVIREVKPEHYSQMQEYMHYMGLPFCLYLAVCKNDDAMYDEVVPYDREEALRCVARALEGISARTLPPRISTNCTSFECKFCDYRGTCHFGELPAKSCRTCAHVTAVVDATALQATPVTEGGAGLWHCAKWASVIPKEAVPVGCDHWTPITD